MLEMSVGVLNARNSYTKISSPSLSTAIST